MCKRTVDLLLCLACAASVKLSAPNTCSGDTDDFNRLVDGFSKHVQARNLGAAERDVKKMRRLAAGNRVSMAIADLHGGRLLLGQLRTDRTRVIKGAHHRTL